MVNKTPEMMKGTNKRNSIDALRRADFDLEDIYKPTPEEVDQALKDAETMGRNMRLYGTIDAPKVKS